MAVRGRSWGLWVFVAVAVAAACRDDGTCEGVEGCTCFPNDTCLQGLSCLDHVCVSADASNDGTVDGGGGSRVGSGDGAQGGDRDSEGGSGAGAGGEGRDDAGRQGRDDGGGEGDAGGGDGGIAAGGGTVEQGDACTSSGECAALDDPCRRAVCVSGACGSASEAESTPLPGQVDGDCKRAVCVAGGEQGSDPDPSDLPADDGDPCTVAVCDGAEPRQAPASMGTPGPDSAQTDGDCQAIVCDGQGGLTVAADDGDVPADPTGDPCTMRICSEEAPAIDNLAAGTPCGGDMVCDGTGGCVSCKPNGSGCSASSECCGGLCQNGTTCASCTQNMGDCDGDVNNGCEASFNSALTCGSCGNDCTGRPAVASEGCSGGTCGISRCEGGRVDADGVFENGCEGTAVIGPGGPYAPCTADNADTACGFGEACGVVEFPFGATSFRECSESDTSCYCAFPCLSSDDCPAAPSGSGTTLGCTVTGGLCYLRCVDSGAVCPDGMHCEEVGSFLLGTSVCLSGPP